MSVTELHLEAVLALPVTAGGAQLLGARYALLHLRPGA